MSKVNHLNGMMVGQQELDRATEAILANDIRQTPVVAEDDFINHIIPLLQRPWVESNRQRYRRWVPEPTQSLRVAGVRDGKTVILFTVPPLQGGVDTTSPVITGITINQLVEQASIMRSRHPGENVDQYVMEYLHQVSQQTPPSHKLLVPIGAILGLYDKTFLDDDGKPLYTLDGSSLPGSSGGGKATTTDTIEFHGYLDED